MKYVYRCYLCNHPDGIEFYNGKPECPSGHTAPYVVPLVFVHWLIPAGPQGPIGTAVGGHCVACNPARKNLQGIAATGQVDAVTCPECMKLNNYENLLAAFREENGFPNRVAPIEG
jgi:hypothetical protein